jgi:outer membrane biosynthesis protein TonB
MEKPIFPGLGTVTPPEPVVHSPDLEKLGTGEYDLLFSGAPDKASDIYKAAQTQSASPSVHLVSSSPFTPVEFIAPVYPRIAQLANASSQVIVQLRVAEDGAATDVQYKTEHAPLFQGATEDAIRKWNFPKEAAGQRIEVVIDFKTNCQRD